MFSQLLFNVLYLLLLILEIWLQLSIMLTKVQIFILCQHLLKVLIVNLHKQKLQHYRMDRHYQVLFNSMAQILLLF